MGHPVVYKKENTMKFSFDCSGDSKQRVHMKSDADSVISAYEDFMICYMELSETQRNLDEVCSVIENIRLSMEMIKVGGAEAVKLLNVDKSLEGLLGVAEEKMTVQVAQEGLSDAAKAVWEKIKAFIKRIITEVRDIINKHSVKVQLALTEQRFKESINKIDDKAFANTMVSTKYFPAHNKINDVLREISSITKIATRSPVGSNYVECCNDVLEYAKKNSAQFKSFVVGVMDDQGLTTSIHILSKLETAKIDINFFGFIPFLKTQKPVFLFEDVSLKDAGYSSVNDLKDVTKLISHLSFSVDDICSHLESINARIPENLLKMNAAGESTGELILSQHVKTANDALSVFLRLIGNMNRSLSTAFSTLLIEQKHAAKSAI